MRSAGVVYPYQNRARRNRLSGNDTPPRKWYQALLVSPSAAWDRFSEKYPRIQARLASAVLLVILIGIACYVLFFFGLVIHILVKKIFP